MADATPTLGGRVAQELLFGEGNPPRDEPIRWPSGTSSAAGLHPSASSWVEDITRASRAVGYLPPCLTCELELLWAHGAVTGRERIGGVDVQVQPEEVLSYRAPRGGLIATEISSGPDRFTIHESIGGPHTGRGYIGLDEAVRMQHSNVGGSLARTSISLTETPRERRGMRSTRQTLEDLARWTGLSHEALGRLLGASRRSVYNWLQGRPISAQFEGRILRARSALESLVEGRTPREMGRWLQQGAPSPGQLLAEERWDELVARVRDELRPRLLRPMPLESWAEEEEVETLGPEVRDAVLAMLSSAPPLQQRRRPDWTPRELTGILPSDEDEEARG